MMAFDKAKYEKEYLRKQSAKRGLPDDDLVERYAVDLSASEAEVAQQVRAVRAYWNSVRPGTRYADVVGICKSQDERQKTEAGDQMLRKAWWASEAEKETKSAAQNVGKLVEQLKSAHGHLGVVTQTAIDAVADTNGVTSQQVGEAAREAGLHVISPRPLPESALKGKRFETLEVKLQVCGAETIPGLLHPESGEFRILNGYKNVANEALRLDLAIVKECFDAAQKTAPGVTNDAKREALQILKTAGEDQVDFALLTLAHLVDLAKAVAAQGPSAVLDELVAFKLERSEAATIAALLSAERSSSGAASKAQVDRLLAEGRLAEARQLAQAIPDENRDQRAAAIQEVNDARLRLDALTAEISSSVAAGNEVKAASLVHEARQISADDAEELLASVPLAPVAALRVVGDANEVKLIWQPNIGHGEGTTYVVTRSESGPPSSLADGVKVASTSEVTAIDPRSPVARPTHYSVFATAPRRPSSRATSSSITMLPPVGNAEADVGSSDMTVHWSTHPACSAVEVNRTEPGKAPVNIAADHNSCRLTGLPEGVPVHVEIVAVYRTPSGDVLRSNVTHVDATPRSAAKPLDRLRVRHIVTDGELRIRVSWTPVDRSEVRILRAASPPPWLPGAWISQTDLMHYGTELTGTHSNGGSDASIVADLEAGTHHLVAVSIGGTGIVVGASTVVGVTDAIRNPTAQAFGSYATVSWQWPDSAQIAEVHWEVDDDQDIFEITRADYRSQGGAKVPLGHSACKVEIRAMINTEAGKFYSPAVRLMVDESEDAEVRYRVASSSGVGGFSGRSKKITFTSEHGCSDIQIRAVASPGPIMPTSTEGKFVILDERLELGPGKPAEYKVTVPKAISKPYWVRCFVVGGDARLLDPPITELKE
jgi:hypothetical protein